MACAVELDHPGPFSPGGWVSGKIICLFTFREYIMGIKCALIGREETTTSQYSQPNQIFSAKATFLKNDVSFAYECTMEAGRYEYPFSFKLPEDGIPGSFSHQYGRVMYLVEGEVCRSPGRIYSGDRIFDVLVNVDLKDLMQYVTMRPVTFPVEEYVDGCCCYSNINATTEMTLEKTGFQVGENINIKIKTVSSSNSTIYNDTTLESYFFFASDSKGNNSRKVREEICKLNKPGEETSFRIKIPERLHIPCFTKCTLIQHLFAVTIMVSVGECHNQIKNQAKIYIGGITEPSRPIGQLQSTSPPPLNPSGPIGPVPVGHAPIDVYPPVAQPPYPVGDPNFPVPSSSHVMPPLPSRSPQGSVRRPVPMPIPHRSPVGRPAPFAPFAEEENRLLRQDGNDGVPASPPPSYEEAIRK